MNGSGLPLYCCTSKQSMGELVLASSNSGADLFFIRRSKALHALLYRHPDATKEDHAFLTETLRIPEEWIHESRAASLCSIDDAWGEYHAHLQAKLYDRAHKILVEKLAPEAVLRDDKVLLRRLCSKLEDKGVSGWDYGGKVSDQRKGGERLLILFLVVLGMGRRFGRYCFASSVNRIFRCHCRLAKGCFTAVRTDDFRMDLDRTSRGFSRSLEVTQYVGS